MAAFTVTDSEDRLAFDTHWARILADAAITVKTIVCDRRVAGYIVSFERFGKPEVGYWLGRDYWNRGVATNALRLFLAMVETRPLYARVASDNAGSMRVLEKCEFAVRGHETAFANARGKEISETVLVHSERAGPAVLPSR